MTVQIVIDIFSIRNINDFSEMFEGHELIIPKKVYEEIRTALTNKRWVTAMQQIIIALNIAFPTRRFAIKSESSKRIVIYELGKIL